MTLDRLPDDVTDHDLLLGGLADGVAENRAAAQRWLRLLTYYRRRERDDGVRHVQAPHFALTARQQTVVEVGQLWGITAGRVRSQLNVVLALSTHFTFVWELCLAGQCDTYRATLVADAARHGLDNDADLRTLARRLEAFLRRHLRPVPGLGELTGVEAVLTCTPKQLRNKLSYEIRRLRAIDAEDRFRKAYEQRDVRTCDGEDGLSWLTIGATTDQTTIAMRRLTLAARQLRAEGDPRSLDQLRSDLAIDLLTGREAGVPLPTYARPVVNLTVPLQAVMGLSDSPGRLSGGQVIPAGLARMIAQTPDATWHRMLTDPAGHLAELSTTRYQPTPAIWAQVVAEHATCFRPGCDAPSAEAELDHRVAWPIGATSTTNLWPGCRTDHKAKHAPGFTIDTTDSGHFVLHTPAGFAHRITRQTQPVEDDRPDVIGIQHSATELTEALAYLDELREQFRPRRWDLDWENDVGEWEWDLAAAV